MSENPIGVWKSPYSSWWWWQHPDCDLDGTWRGLSWGSEVTAAKAADAGREHLRRFHAPIAWSTSEHMDGDRMVSELTTYSRRCGVHTAACEAQTCRCVPVYPGSENGPENAIQRCGYCGHPADEHLGRWCRHVTGAIKADGRQRICCCEGADRDWPDDTGPIAHDNPLQTAHNQSREDC